MSHSLFLHPRSPLPETTRTQLILRLAEAGFLAPADDGGHPLPGPRLMEFITYLGCSPALSSGGVEAGLQLHAFDAPRWLGGEAIDRLRFPGCGHPVDNGAELLRAGSPWRCPQCDNRGRLEDIAWRRSAAEADFFIEIAPIFPREAVPSDALLSLLEQTSGTEWKWFYSRSRNL